jgi:hypothetical protein
MGCLHSFFPLINLNIGIYTLLQLSQCFSYTTLMQSCLCKKSFLLVYDSYTEGFTVTFPYMHVLYKICKLMGVMELKMLKINHDVVSLDTSLIACFSVQVQSVHSLKVRYIIAFFLMNWNKSSLSHKYLVKAL